MNKSAEDPIPLLCVLQDIHLALQAGQPQVAVEHEVNL